MSSPPSPESQGLPSNSARARRTARWTMPAGGAAPSALSPEAAAAARSRANVGAGLVALGLIGVLWGVFFVLGALPTAEKLDFAHRMTDYQARKSVHESFPGGLLRALFGLAVALWGGRMRARARRELGHVDA